MTGRDPEIVVIGSGPNGLVAACVLARRGHRVLVLEANPRRPGGALGSVESTLPGFVHDVGAAFFPFGQSSPAFRELDLGARGVEWCHGAFESCHPAEDGSVAAIARDPELTASCFGNPRDAERWRRLAHWYASIDERMLAALLGPLPSFGRWLSLGLGTLLRIGRIFAASPRRLSERWFESEAARRVLPGLALHADIGPGDAFGAALGFVLAMSAGKWGFPVPRGGARSLCNALVTLLEECGGRVRLGARVERIVVREGRARAVVLHGGEEIAFARALMADVAAPRLLTELLSPEHVPGRVLRRMRKAVPGWGTFKLDWALSAAVSWRVEAATRSAVVHLGESNADLARFTAEVRAGRLPERPYLVVGQQSLLDPTRAPAGAHTLYAYTHVPATLGEGWDEARESFADRVEQRIEALAPGFRATILGRSISDPARFERDNANLIGGDLGGGTNRFTNQLVFRPVFPYYRYRMPVRRLYLCSSYAHPGGGVHGMCGYNAAHAALADIERNEDGRD